MAIYGIAMMTVGMFIFWAIPHVASAFFRSTPESVEIGTVELELSAGGPHFCRVLIMRGGVFQALARAYSM